jgi:hypothetical protein
VEPVKVTLLADNAPVVAVTSPENGSISDRQELLVKGYARDDRELKSLEVSVNGSRAVERNLSGKRHDFAETIELGEGSNEVLVVVKDSKGQQEAMTIRVTYLGKYPILRGFYKNVWAVVVGIGRYQDSRIDALPCAESDARSVEALIRDKLVVREVMSLYNEEATKENIQKVLQGRLSQAGRDDAVLIYFACHGATFDTGSGPLGDIIPYDGSMDKAERYRNISMQLFKDDIARAIPAKHLLLLVNACYGGLMTRSMTIKPTSPQTRDGSYLGTIKDKEAKLVITAGKQGETVLDSGGQGKSVFASRLIEAVDHAEYFISATELYGQIKQRVAEDASRYSHSQTPQLGFWWGDGDFVLIKK